MSDGFKPSDVRYLLCPTAYHKPSDITAVGPQATGKTVAMPYLRRSDGAVGDSLCPTAAVGHNAISDALSSTA
jgi:hypothetical protein